MIPIYKRATEPEILEKRNLSVNGASWNAWARGEIIRAGNNYLNLLLLKFSSINQSLDGNFQRVLFAIPQQFHKKSFITSH